MTRATNTIINNYKLLYKSQYGKDCGLDDGTIRAIIEECPVYETPADDEETILENMNTYPVIIW